MQTNSIFPTERRQEELLKEIAEKLGAAYSKITSITRGRNKDESLCVMESSDLEGVLRQVESAQSTLTDCINREEELENAQKAFLELVKDLVHDLADATSSVYMVFETLRRIPEKDMEAGKEWYMKAATTSNAQAVGVLNILKALLEKKKMSYHPTLIELTEIVESSVLAYQPQLHRNKINVTVSYEPADEHQELYILGDQTRMQSVMLNILKNMNTALGMTKDARIDIYIQRQEGSEGRDSAKLTVRNNGPPMPYEDPNEAFNPEAPGKGASRRGLHICKRTIETRFEGKIHAEHPPEGGVAFYIEIPLCTEEEVKTFKSKPEEQPL